jgi:phosphoheptose isomerase
MAGSLEDFTPDFQLEIVTRSEDSPRVMSIRDIINDSIGAVTTLFTLEKEIFGAAAMLRETLLSGHKALVCGNGGSAADSSHLATELACRFISDRRPYPAISLAAEGSLMTAIGNDYSFTELFARQVAAFGAPGDLLITMTTSGKSENIRRAIEQAKKQGMKTIALLGRDGGFCLGLSDLDILVPLQVTARIQEAHKVIIHLLCELIEPDLVKNSQEFLQK